MSVDSGSVKNEKTTHYTYKMPDGTPMTEKIVLDKDKNKVVEHKVNGEDVKKTETDTKPKETEKFYYQPGNGEQFVIRKIDELNKTMTNIFNQLKEMNYYLCKAHGDDSDIERIKDLLNG